jgi:hypothetical protein
MKFDSDINRLFKLAVFTSPLIGVLAITPIFIHRAVSISIFTKAVLIITLATLTVWWLNIYLFYMAEKFRTFKYVRVIRYILSYIISAALIMAAMRMLKLGLYSQAFVPDMTSRHFPFATSLISLSINSVILILENLVLIKGKQAATEIENARLKLKKR